VIAVGRSISTVSPAASSDDDPRVDERDRVGALVGLVDEHALEDADLRRREPDSARALHDADHPLDERRERSVELDHLARLQAQHGIRVLPDVQQHVAPPRVALRALVDGLLVVRLGHERSLAAPSAAP
jgi:hypothetical protein